MPTKKRGSGSFDNREQCKRINENSHSYTTLRQHTDIEIKPRCRSLTSVSFSFPEDELYELYTNRPTMYHLMRSGKYAYVDEHLVLDLTKYIRRTINGVHLTDYVAANLRECCIAIRWRYRRTPPRTNNPSRKRLPGIHYQMKKYPGRELVGVSFIAAARCSQRISKSGFMEYISGGQEPPHDTFGHAHIFFMERANVTEEILSEKTGITVRTIGRLRNNAHQPTLEYVIAICIALTLSYSETELMAALAGYDISGASLRQTPQIKAYQFLVDVMRYNWTVGECNAFLKEHELRPLTKL